MLIWFEPGRAGVSAASGIVRAHEVSTVMEIDELLQRARQECDAMLGRAAEDAGKVVEDAQRRAEEILAEARQQASGLLEQASHRSRAEVERGFAEGQQQAAVQWHQRHAEQQAAKSAEPQVPEHKLADLVAVAVQRIVDAEPRQALFRRALQTVQELMQRTGTVILRVSVGDADHARAAVASWSVAPPPDGLLVEVKPDAALAQGRCLFESDIGTLDASLDLQLAGLRSALDRAVGKALAEPDAHEDDADAGLDPEMPPVSGAHSALTERAGEEPTEGVESDTHAVDEGDASSNADAQGDADADEYDEEYADDQEDLASGPDENEHADLEANHG